MKRHGNAKNQSAEKPEREDDVPHGQVDSFCMEARAASGSIAARPGITTKENAKKNPAITPTQTAQARRSQTSKGHRHEHIPKGGDLGPRAFISRTAATPHPEYRRFFVPKGEVRASGDQSQSKRA